MKSHRNCDDGEQAEVWSAKACSTQCEKHESDPEREKRHPNGARLQRPVVRDAEETGEERRDSDRGDRETGDSQRHECTLTSEWSERRKGAV